MRIAETVVLTGVPEKDKVLDGTMQGMEATGKAAGFASQAGQVVTQFGIITFHTVSFGFVWHGRVNAWGVEERLIDGQ